VDRAEERLKALLATIESVDELVIMPHNDPDPDSIAAAVAMRYLVGEMLGIECRILYRGIVGRAENKALLHYLGNPLSRLPVADPCPPLPLALIDTQPGAGNNSLSQDCDLRMVLDHHPHREETRQVPFSDVRPGMGAASTMLTEYLRAAGITPPAWLATTLFYGIKTDTMGLSRGTCQDDVEAYFYLQPLIEIDALAQIERAQVPPQYFRSLVAALQAARIYDNLLLSYVGRLAYPGLAAEMADLMLRLEGTEWVVCYGAYEEELILSIRTTQDSKADQVVQQIVGELGTAGGHGALAGGQIPFIDQDPDDLAHDLREHILSTLGLPEEMEGRPLV
jgi:nanoRNase/pAp phosphatase (c-di-AMP/oligoRNAs hydrolase)